MYRCSPEFLNILSSKIDPESLHRDGHNSPPILFSTNRLADELNTERLESLEGKKTNFEALDKGQVELLSGLSIPAKVSLKVGARVLVMANNKKLGLTKGMFGKVVSISGNQTVLLKLSSGGSKIVPRQDFHVEYNGEILATRNQLPLILAWGITIHKSQGLEFNEVIVDLSSCFQDGQGYTALSRVKSLDGLTLLGLNRNSIRASEKALEYEASAACGTYTLTSVCLSVCLSVSLLSLQFVWCMIQCLWVCCQVIHPHV